MNRMTPQDLQIIPRNRRFDRATSKARWWAGNDPVATAFYNALSVTFPRGEAFFIESVNAFREGVPERLDREIKAFVAQEVVHSREHVVFNRLVADNSHDFAPLEADVIDLLEKAKALPAIARLSATMALEHFTAIFAHDLLADPAQLDGADAESAALWRWHAIEEIEHKGVAFDTWMHATRGWGRWRRWKLRSVMMLIVTRNFVRDRTRGMLELLRQDGIEGPRARIAVLRFLFWSPGLFLRAIPAWLGYFLPGFHPWNEDDRELIIRNREFAAA